MTANLSAGPISERETLYGIVGAREDKDFQGNPSFAVTRAGFRGAQANTLRAVATAVVAMTWGYYDVFHQTSRSDGKVSSYAREGIIAAVSPSHLETKPKQKATNSKRTLWMDPITGEFQENTPKETSATRETEAGIKNAMAKLQAKA
ncbi:MAG TPA: hypothetical protein EYQ69_07035 [Gemmatimonadetes bacterium]|nr:hypothetical protein [Gemmatimonadota bacterium]